VDPASKRVNLGDFTRGIRYRLTGSPFEQTFTYYQHAKDRFSEALSRPDALAAGCGAQGEFAQCLPALLRHPPDSGGRIGSADRRRVLRPVCFTPGPHWPFPNASWICSKCGAARSKSAAIQTFPGCLYSEMKMCLAPCFAGCSKEEYDGEVQRLLRFLETSGGSMRASIEEEREKASGQLDFERAAALHKKIEKLDEVLRGRPELTRRIQDLRCRNLAAHRRGPNDRSVRRPRRPAWTSRFSCALRKSPASRGPRNKSFAITSRVEQLLLPAISGSNCGSSGAGTTAIRARVRYFSAKGTGPIVGFFEPALGSWPRKRA